MTNRNEDVVVVCCLVMSLVLYQQPLYDRFIHIDISQPQGSVTSWILPKTIYTVT